MTLPLTLIPKFPVMGSESLSYTRNPRAPSR